jgi:hypothetical protein
MEYINGYSDEDLRQRGGYLLLETVTKNDKEFLPKDGMEMRKLVENNTAAWNAIVAKRAKRKVSE